MTSFCAKNQLGWGAMLQHFRFDCGTGPSVETKLREKTAAAPKSKVDIHREINVVANDEADARIRAIRRWADGAVYPGDEQGLPPEYKLVRVFALGSDWNKGVTNQPG